MPRVKTETINLRPNYPNLVKWILGALEDNSIQKAVRESYKSEIIKIADYAEACAIEKETGKKPRKKRTTSDIKAAAVP